MQNITTATRHVQKSKEYPKTATSERINKMSNLLFSVTCTVRRKLSLRKLCFDYNSINLKTTTNWMQTCFSLSPPIEKIVVTSVQQIIHDDPGRSCDRFTFHRQRRANHSSLNWYLGFVSFSNYSYCLSDCWFINTLQHSTHTIISYESIAAAYFITVVPFTIWPSCHILLPTSSQSCCCCTA